MYKLLLDHNNISEIHPHFFKGLFSLGKLHLEHNSISVIQPLQFQNTSAPTLYLNHNNISVIHPDGFRGILNLYVLHLQNNHILSIYRKHFEPLHQLVYLDLSYNNLIIFSLSSTVLSTLKYISLADNKLRLLSLSMLYNMSLLRYADFSRNRINIVNEIMLDNSSTNSESPVIETIDLRGNALYSLNAESFKGFRKSTRILVDNEATCCFITLVNCSATIPRSQFLTCGRLLPNTVQRVSMWALGLFAILSNLGVLFYRYYFKQKENKVQTLLISNLSISDTIMGIYMIIIVSADSYYKRMFPSELWRLSFPCKFAGTLSVLSSEASVFFVTLISVDRLMGIKFAFSTYRIGTTRSRILSLILWIIAVSVSIVSTIISSINPDLYDVSEVCTGLPLSRTNVYENKIDEQDLGEIFIPGAPVGENIITIIVNSIYDVIVNHKPGMYYGIAIFTVLNSICFIAVCVCYTLIFVTAIQTAKKAGRTPDMKQELKMATKMGAIVFTDMACWLPIIILSILVQSGRHVVTPHVYTWIVTFVLPINSAINPFLYTFASLIFDYF